MMLDDEILDRPEREVARTMDAMESENSHLRKKSDEN